MSEADLRENKTVDYLGTLFGQPIYTDPFRFEDERDAFVAQLWSLVGLPTEVKE